MVCWQNALKRQGQAKQAREGVPGRGIRGQRSAGAEAIVAENLSSRFPGRHRTQRRPVSCMALITGWGEGALSQILGKSKLFSNP